MTTMNRRNLLATVVAASAAAGTLTTTSARAADAAPKTEAGKGADKDVTKTLARYLVGATYDQLPANVRKEGTRTLLNWVGVAIGGSHEPAVNIAATSLAPFSGPAQSSLLGRRERFDVMNAAFVNGVAGHVLDYDDTHLKTIVHPGAIIGPSMLAFAEYKPVNGKDFLNAFVLGVEVACRMGNAVYPNHYDIGWHITGTAGVFGVAAGVGKLLKLNEQQMIYALGLAASQPVGLRESFGSMNKSFNPGRAAANGIFAALLAQGGYDSSNAMIEAQRGWANTISTKQDYHEITGELGQRYESLLNTYKPFPCGVVLHPILDAAIQLQRANKLDIDKIDHVALKIHPNVLELTGKKTPADGLESKFSVYHATAVALIEGAGGMKQFSDRAAKDPKVITLRQKVQPTIDPAIKPDQVDMTIVFKDGKTLHKFIEHAVGSVEAPLSDEDLQRKFLDLTDGILPRAQCDKIIDMCWKVEGLANAGDISAATRAAT